MVKLTDCLDMTIAVDWNVKHKPNKQMHKNMKPYFSKNQEVLQYVSSAEIEISTLRAI